MSNRKFAVFDIDGTIFRYALFQALLERLVEKDIIPRHSYNAFEQELNDWKNRTHDESFADFAMAQVKLFDQYITSISIVDLEQTALEILEESAGHVYRFTRDLLEDLRTQNYFLIAISGSISEISHPFAQMYGFDAVQSTEYDRTADGYTGSFTLKHKGKHIYIEQLIEEHQLDRNGSIAIGDSIGDVSMLDFVEHPIAFNPEKRLYDIAISRQWTIVVERKNMSYKLEPSDGRYILDQTG